MEEENVGQASRVGIQLQRKRNVALVVLLSESLGAQCMYHLGREVSGMTWASLRKRKGSRTVSERKTSALLRTIHSMIVVMWDVYRNKSVIVYCV